MKKANKKYELSVESYGLYTRWDRNSRGLPEIVKFTNEIMAETDAEFGMVLHIRKGKGVKLNFIIEHPPFKGKDGKPLPDFTGEHMITSNDYHFFIGDSIWDPLEDKCGRWAISVFNKTGLLVKKEFIVFL